MRALPHLSRRLLLVVGRVDEARSDIEQALKLDSRNGHAYALRAIISVQNQKDEALSFAAKAVELDRQSSTARIALAYAQQAKFQTGRGSLRSRE